MATSPRLAATARLCRRFRLLAFSYLLAGVITTHVFAQATTGSITGRIFNPATQEYLRNAEIAAESTDRVAYSGDDGVYVLTNLPAGEVTLTVSYTGYDRATARVSVAGGQTAVRDFELKGASFEPG